MASLSNDKLRESIAEILKGADLNSLSSKKVRLSLEEKHNVDLSDRKKELDAMIMEMISASQSGESGKRSAVANGASDQSGDSGSEDVSEEEYSPQKKKAKGAKAPAKSKKSKGSDDDDDDEEVEEKEEKKGKGGKGGGGGARKGKSTYSKKCILSPELADVMGCPEMARHEVVKKMWQIVKERNLADPKNKQFAVCDDQLLKVFGVKRFRTFGMMKFLKNHIKDAR